MKRKRKPRIAWAATIPALTLDALAEMQRKLCEPSPYSTTLVATPLFAKTLRRWNSKRKRAKR